jgi:hypothetical protein
MNDIKTLPFQKIKGNVDYYYNLEYNELLELAKIGLRNRIKNKKKLIAKIVASNFDSEAGSDGIEEEIEESYNFADPDELELGPEDTVGLYEHAKERTIEEFLKHTNLANNYSWVLPQMVSHFGNWVAVKDEETGLYDPVKTQLLNTENDNFAYGVWVIATKVDRTKLANPVKPTRWYSLKEFNHLVPLVLWGFKQYQNIPYSKWMRKGIEKLVDAPLADAMLSQTPDMTNEELLELRKHGLTVATGAKAGEVKSPVTTSGLSHLATYTKHDISHLNKLAICMITQTWVAHPDNRHLRAQILNPLDWDSVPEPLTGSNVIKSAFDLPSKKVPTNTRW